MQVRAHFRPEFINRLDDIVIFKPLNRAELHRITQLMVTKVAARLSERGIKLQVTADALDFILEQSYNPAYGARCACVDGRGKLVLCCQVCVCL